MKVTVFSLFAAVLLLQTQVSSAADNECQKAFGINVANCMQSIDSQLLTPKEQADAYKACIEDARVAKVACLNGVDQCLTLCQAAYDQSASVCQFNYDPLTHCAVDNIICQAQYSALEAQCLSDALSTLNSCTYSCQN